MKKTVLFIISLVFIITLFGCKKEVILTIEENEIEIFVEDNYTIKAKLENSESKIIYEIIEGEGVVLLNDNNVYGKTEGKAIIKVFVEGNSDINEELIVNVKAKELLPELEVIKKEITLINEKATAEIEAMVKNIEGKIIYTIISGNDVIKLTNNVVSVIKEGKAVVRVSIDGYLEIYVDIDINVVFMNDEEKPIISFESEDKLQLNWGKDITIETLMNGVTSYDEIDGDITKNIKVTHNINNKKYGTYVVTYECVDASGNKAIEEREVEIIWDYAVEFIGHQGCYYGVPNTEEAFLYAADVLHYQALETDVKQTKDGVFVCCHDDTFAGVSIKDVTWDELKDVVATASRSAGYPSQYNEMPGNGKYSSKICSLERYLEICKEYGIKAVIELKSSNGISNDSQSRMPALMELIKSKDMLEQTIFLASAYNCLIWVKQNGYDYIPCQYLVGSCESETYFNRCVEYGLDISINTTYGDYSNSPEWIARYQDAGLKVSTYTYTQYSDYKDVQKWIDAGVDFVTCDWHTMNKLNLPENKDIVYHTVKFFDKDNKLIKETKVKDGRTAASPIAPEVKGYTFSGWSKDIRNVTCDLDVCAEYELTNYKIIYDSNLYISTKSKWNTKNDFVNDFYNDLFDWIVANKNNLSCVTEKNGTYTIKVNSTEYGSATFKNAQDIKDTYVYNFERTFATLIYKPINGTNSESFIPEVDNNYFLNSEPYRSKYMDCNAYFLNVMKKIYPSYSQTYQQASNNRVQIFFRFHQWCNGSDISTFDNYPSKYIVKYLVGVNATMPTDHLTYTIEDEFILSNPESSIAFLGWYIDKDCEGEKVLKIEKGNTGDITLYAKWEEVDIPDTYSNIIYVLDGGVNNTKNKETYLEGVSTILYPASKEGYDFLGWSKEKDSTTYISEINELTSGEITLYANYTYTKYSISYDLQNGVWGNEAKFSGSATTSIVTTEKNGFWENGYLTNIYLNTTSSHPAAVWSFRVAIGLDDAMGIYIVTAIADSGKTFDDSNSVYVITISGSYSNYSSTSAFRSSVKVGQGVKFIGDPESGKATVEFYNEENIEFEPLENYIDEYTIVSLPALLPTPSMDGKVFKGWSLNSNLSGDIFTSLPEGIKGNITLYAVFE